MASVRQVAQCIGLPGGVSLVHDFFGHRRMPSGRSYSLLNQIGLLKGPHLHLNIILVGSDQFTDGQRDLVDRAVFDIRKIYSQVNLGVGRVEWRFVPVSLANGHEDIDSNDEADELTNSWTVHNNGHDIFVVRSSWAEDGVTKDGVSPIDGSCDKDGKSMTGTVVSLGAGVLTGVVMAHEVAHYLGLKHIDGLEADDVLEGEFTGGQVANLMFPLITGLSTLTAGQGGIMKQHCLVQPGC